MNYAERGLNGNNPTHTFEGGRPSFTDSYNKKTSRQELSAAKMHYRKRRRKKKKREKNVKKRDAAIVSRRNPNTVRYSKVLMSQHTFCRLVKPLVPNHRPDGFIYDIDDPHEVSNGKLSATNLVP